MLIIKFANIEKGTRMMVMAMVMMTAVVVVVVLEEIC